MALTPPKNQISNSLVISTGIEPKEYKDHNLIFAYSLITLKQKEDTCVLLACFRAEAMVFSSVRVIILLICVGFLAVQVNKVDGLTSVELAIRHSKNAPVTVSSHQRILTESAMQSMKTEKKAASLKKRLDPYRSSKRRVRKGSDPIHNRS